MGATDIRQGLWPALTCWFIRKVSHCAGDRDDGKIKTWPAAPSAATRASPHVRKKQDGEQDVGVLFYESKSFPTSAVAGVVYGRANASRLNHTGTIKPNFLPLHRNQFKPWNE